jgi:hypothetical protein
LAATSRGYREWPCAPWSVQYGSLSGTGALRRRQCVDFPNGYDRAHSVSRFAILDQSGRKGVRLCTIEDNSELRGTMLVLSSKIALFALFIPLSSIPVAHHSGRVAQPWSDHSRECLNCPETVRTCSRVTSARLPTQSRVRVQYLTGTFELTVIATGMKRDSVAIGRLRLQPGGEARQAPASTISYPLYGSSSVDLQKFGRVSLAYSPAKESVQQPGVQAMYDARTRTYSLAFGNAVSSLGVERDAGVYFASVDANEQGFRGTWSDGGRLKGAPHGYFCAVRDP